MPIGMYTSNVAVTDAAAIEIARFRVEDLRSLLVKFNGGAGYLGIHSVSSTNGMYMANGGSWALSHDDFVPGDTGELILWAIAAAGESFTAHTMILAVK